VASRRAPWMRRRASRCPRAPGGTPPAREALPPDTYVRLRGRVRGHPDDTACRRRDDVTQVGHPAGAAYRPARPGSMPRLGRHGAGTRFPPLRRPRRALRGDRTIGRWNTATGLPPPARPAKTGRVTPLRRSRGVPAGHGRSRAVARHGLASSWATAGGGAGVAGSADAGFSVPAPGSASYPREGRRAP
jgi:hypothetical protein